MSTEAINLASKHCRTDPGVVVSTGQPAAMNDLRQPRRTVRPDKAAHTRRYAWFEAFSAGLFVTVRFSQHGTGSGWTAGWLMGSRGSPQ